MNWQAADLKEAREALSRREEEWRQARIKLEKELHKVKVRPKEIAMNMLEAGPERHGSKHTVPQAALRFLNFSP